MTGLVRSPTWRRVAGDAARCAAIGLRVRLMDLNRAPSSGKWARRRLERGSRTLGGVPRSGEKLRVRSVACGPWTAVQLALGATEEYVWVQPQPEDPRLGVDGLQP